MFNLLCEGNANNNNWIMIAVIGVLMVVMLLITIIPQRKRKKEAQQMMQSVRVGKKIKTIGGFVGEIVGMDNDQGTIELNVGSAENPVIVVMDKAAIYTVLNPDIPVQEQQEQKADEEVVPVAVTAEDAEADAVQAEKDAAKRAKKEQKAREKAEKKAMKEAEKNAQNEPVAEVQAEQAQEENTQINE